MHDNDQQQLSIGAVAQLTQIPAHTLRKWESRHGIAVPIRSETGRRVYTQEHVEQLRLIKALVADGHSLAHLAGRDIEALRELAGMHQITQPKTSVSSLTLVGPNLSRQLTAHPLVNKRYSGNIEEWIPRATDIKNEAIIAECETLPANLVRALVDLREQAQAMIVVYTFASRATLEQLHQAGIQTLQAPANDQTLLAQLEPTQGNREASTAPPVRFSTKELARIASLNPGIQCECPNHIAKLLMDIASFEKYSRECVDSDPAEAALHQHLGDISAQARALFEEALIAVATADGLQLSIEH